jgi:pentatricopeptide repeat protein
MQELDSFIVQQQKDQRDIIVERTSSPTTKSPDTTEIVDIEKEKVNGTKFSASIEKDVSSRDDRTLSNAMSLNAETTTTATPTPAEVRAQRLVEVLDHSLRKHQVKRSLELYEKARQNDILLPKKQIADLFFVVSAVDPIKAFSILQYYNSHPGTLHIKLSMYKRICTCVSLLDPAMYNLYQMESFIVSLLEDIDEMDDEAKALLYPNLVVTLAKQPRVWLGRYAGEVYQYIKDKNFDISQRWLVNVLSLSKYNRQEDLPFHDVMAELAARGCVPDSKKLLQAIQNMFPYTDTEQMTVVLKAYLQIENNALARHYRDMNADDDDDNDISDGNNARNGLRTLTDTDDEADMKEEEEVDDDDDDITHFSSWYPQTRHEGNVLKIDMSTLEMISAGAARAGNSELMLLVWDVLEHCHYRPNEAIYENTVLSFASEGRKGLRQAFSAMASMKQDGFVPARPFIRSFCFELRGDKRLVNEALRIVLDEDEGVDNPNDDDGHPSSSFSSQRRQPLLSLESLNVILSCLAERGDTDDAIEVLRIFRDYDIEPNEDSYSFAMEALGKELHRLQVSGKLEYNSSSVHKNIQLAGSLLSEMEDVGLTPSTDVVRNYLELLCLANEVETATAVTEDLLKDSYRNRVNNKAIYRVALANAEAGNFDKAKELAGLTSEVIPSLYRRINYLRPRSGPNSKPRKRWRRRESPDDDDNNNNSNNDSNDNEKVLKC